MKKLEFTEKDYSKIFELIGDLSLFFDERISELHEVFFNEEPPQELIVKSYSGAEITQEEANLKNINKAYKIADSFIKKSNGPI